MIRQGVGRDGGLGKRGGGEVQPNLRSSLLPSQGRMLEVNYQGVSVSHPALSSCPHLPLAGPSPDTGVCSCPYAYLPPYIFALDCGPSSSLLHCLPPSVLCSIGCRSMSWTP